ncbi:MAG: hypothetical protein RLZZ249_482 [Actinomycetota bacterium]|jgi:hypothetical protein
MIESFASGFLVFAYLATALFQLAIVLGAPLGEYAYGGQREGKLPMPYRVASAVSFLVMLALAGHYLAQTGVLTPLLPADQNAIVNWVLVGLAALAALMNNITKSQKEKRLWGSTTLAMLLSAVLVAL